MTDNPNLGAISIYGLAFLIDENTEVSIPTGSLNYTIKITNKMWFSLSAFSPTDSRHTAHCELKLTNLYILHIWTPQQSYHYSKLYKLDYGSILLYKTTSEKESNLKKDCTSLNSSLACRSLLWGIRAGKEKVHHILSIVISPHLYQKGGLLRRASSGCLVYIRFQPWTGLTELKTTTTFSPSNLKGGLSNSLRMLRVGRDLRFLLLQVHHFTDEESKAQDRWK